MTLRRPSLRTVFACVAGIVLLTGLVEARLLPVSILAHIEDGLSRVRELGTVGMIVFAAIQIAVAMSGFVPGSLIGLVSGAVYGIPIGFPLAAFSTLAGALLAFLLSRSIFRPLLVKLLLTRARLQGFETMIARDGWRFVCLLRLSPIMPFAATSYMLGASSVTVRSYLIGTLASLPALLGYVIIGSLAKAGFAAASHGTSVVQWLLICFGVVATALLTWRLGRLAAAAGLISRAPLRENT